MNDKITKERVDCLHPLIKCLVETCIEQAEVCLGKYACIRVVQGFRTFPEQASLFSLGRTIKNPSGATPAKPMGNIVTNAKAGQSNHNYGLSIDFAILYDKDKNGTFETLSWDLIADFNKDGEADWKEVVYCFTSAGFAWGGNWHTLKDNPHLEMTFGLNWRQMLERHNNKDFIAGTEFIRI